MISQIDETSAPALRRARIRVQGTVQGVGFRPFVFRLASSLALGGFVRNDVLGVDIELEGSDASVERFLDRLIREAPAHARIERVIVRDIEPVYREADFEVLASSIGGDGSAGVAPDLCTCADCLYELFDSSNRRYRYPFINCTACGPRFTIARGVPYDRAATTMAGFEMCDECQAEYDDPTNRRFHAQPNACAVCGPRAELVDANGRTVRYDDLDAVAAAARALREGLIVAVKGLGGYHLACRADESEVVARLRERKHRDEKPFALMAHDIELARCLVCITPAEMRLLTSDARPIVIARAQRGVAIASEVAPGREELGVMLPYTPLHHLLMTDLEVPLVMTSGNRSDEPIAYRDDDARARLSTIADVFLTHDRRIEARCEDSVARIVRVAGRTQTLMIRRARGFVPEPLPMPVPAEQPVLATGAQLKNTACMVRDGAAVVGPHAGDLGDATTFAAYVRGIDHLARLSRTEPAIVAHDLHPEYQSTNYALARDDLDAVGVQHHHAHLAACLAEYGETGPAIGVIFDGAGLGTDGSMWGGEILFGDLDGFTRLGHLRAITMPGGDAAVREPWRMACSWLTDAHGCEPALCNSLQGVVDPAQWSRISSLSRSGGVQTTSVGRLLDACAAICGIHPCVSFEGQAAIAFEAKARRTLSGPRAVLDDESPDAYAMSVEWIDGRMVIDPREWLLAVERDANAGRDKREISRRAHTGLIYAARVAAQSAADQTGSGTIVLSGGVFQNVLILEALAAALARRGCRVLVPRRLPPNDGGISYGQAVVAAWQRRSDVSGDSRPSR